MEFTGKITEIREVRSGTGAKGEWANVAFEVTEQTDKYPQAGLFTYFKNGDNVKYAKDFGNYYKVGDEVTVEFNLKKNTYTKDGEEKSFYETSAWKINKVEGVTTPEDDLPF